MKNSSMLKYLNLFERYHKGPVTNFFLIAIRDLHMTDIEEIKKWALNTSRSNKYYTDWNTGKVTKRDSCIYHEIIENNIDHPDLPTFLDYYIRYSELPREEQQQAKKRKISVQNRQKFIIKEIFNSKRPLSWSALSSFEYNADEFFKKYILGQTQMGNQAMEFGKVFAKSCEDRKPLAPVTLLDTMEKKFSVVFSGIHLIGFADTYCSETKRKMGEYKTGKKKWDQNRVDNFGQITMYCLMNFITHKIKPEDTELFLEWIPTQDEGDFSVAFQKPIVVHHFKTKRTMSDILTFGNFIISTMKQMELYVQNHE